jgi:hypothetical protein
VSARTKGQKCFSSKRRRRKMRAARTCEAAKARPAGVKCSVFIVREPLPVFVDKRTLSASVGTSQKGQKKETWTTQGACIGPSLAETPSSRRSQLSRKRPFLPFRHRLPRQNHTRNAEGKTAEAKYNDRDGAQPRM